MGMLLSAFLAGCKSLERRFKPAGYKCFHLRFEGDGQGSGDFDQFIADFAKALGKVAG
jgi:hypothetical protein